MTLHPCEFCELLTNNEEDEYGQFVCDDCEQNKAELAWERHCENLHGGGGAPPLGEQLIQARKLK
jgi:hypothetical protein